MVTTGNQQSPGPSDYLRRALHYQLLAMPDEALQDVHEILLNIYNHYKKTDEDNTSHID